MLTKKGRIESSQVNNTNELEKMVASLQAELSRQREELTMLKSASLKPSANREVTSRRKLLKNMSIGVVSAVTTASAIGALKFQDTVPQVAAMATNPSSTQILGVINVEDFKTDTGSDYTTAFAAAFAAIIQTGKPGTVWVPPGKDIFASSIVLPHRCGLLGAGYSSRIIQAPNATTPLITTAPHAQNCFISNLSIDGNRWKQTKDGCHAIVMTNNLPYQASLDEYNDGRHTVSNVEIKSVRGTGLKFIGRGVNTASNVRVFQASENGFYSDWDNQFVACDAGASGLEGFYTLGSSVRFTSCKSWFSGELNPARGYGFYFSNVISIEMSGCEAQDNRNSGYFLKNFTGSLSGCVADSNGSDATNAHAAGFEFDGGYGACVTGGIAKDRNANASKQKYALAFTGAVSSNCEIHISSQGNQLGNIWDVNNTMAQSNKFSIGNAGGFRYIDPVSNFTPDWVLGTIHRLDLISDVVIANTNGPVPFGTQLVFIFRQDSKGGHKVVWGNQYKVSSSTDTTPWKYNSISFTWFGDCWVQTQVYAV